MLEEMGENIVKQGWDAKKDYTLRAQRVLRSYVQPSTGQERILESTPSGRRAPQGTEAVKRNPWRKKINGRKLLKLIVSLQAMLGGQQDSVTCKQCMCNFVPVVRDAAVDPESETASGAHIAVFKRPLFVAQRIGG